MNEWFIRQEDRWGGIRVVVVVGVGGALGERQDMPSPANEN